MEGLLIKTYFRRLNCCLTIQFINYLCIFFYKIASIQYYIYVKTLDKFQCYEFPI